MADEKHGNPGDPADDDLDASASGADEPTAMWDFEELRKAGLNELGPLPEHDATPPVTQGLAASATAPSIVVEPEATRARSAVRAAQPSTELSWPVTVSIALVLGGAVYALIRFVL